MPIPALLPASLSLPPGIAAAFVDSTLAYDYAIAGYPFLTAIRDERPFYRRTAEFKREQIDQTASPGEQTLSGWWYRSQMSWHGGAGQLYGDPNSSDRYTDIRFFDSAGVDVWTAGIASLLPNTVSVSHAAVSDAVGYHAEGADCALFVGGTTPRVVSTSGGTDTTTAGTWGFSPSPTACTTDGGNLYVGSSAGIYKSPTDSDAASLSWSLLWNSGSPVGALEWVHGRLIAGIGDSIYELAGGTPPTLPTALYEHPTPGWVWTSIAESPTAIYAAGYSGVTGGIYKFTVSADDGGLPTLTGGIVTAVLPTGEVPHAIHGYLGSYIAIGTNKGIRVATVGNNGDLTYGPLIVETEQPVYGFASRDRFLWATASGHVAGQFSGTIRVDLGLDISDGGLRFAYANDLFHDSSTGTVKGISFIGGTDRLAFADQGNVFYAHATQRRTTGWLQSSRIRFNTLEPKLYKLLRIRGPELEGALTVSTIDQNGSETSILNLTGNPGQEDLQISQPTGPQEFLSLKFTLNRSTLNAALGAAITGYQIKGLPGVARKRQLVIPLLCMDIEKDENGVKWGYDGAALERLEALEAAEDTGGTVLVQELKTGRAYECTIQDIVYVQQTPSFQEQGYSGYVTVTLRTV